MGRLDNAMRRAAEEAAGKAAPEPRQLMDVRDLPPAEFPSEEVSVAAVATAPEPFEAGTSREPVIAAVDPAVTQSDGRLLPDLKHQLNAELDTKTVVDEHMLPASREQYRRLAAAFHQAQRATGCKVAMIASAVAGEGKSLTAANLALTLSESYRRNVLLIDADLRRPSQHSIFQVSGAPGLSEGLISTEEPKLPLHRLSSRLTVLPAGRPTSDPIGAITSDRMRRLVEEAREVFDWVIIDTPPVGLLTDASLLASMTDGVVLVVKAESTPFDLVNRAVEALGRERMMGVVLNRAREQAHSSSYDYYKYYTPTESTLG